MSQNLNIRLYEKKVDLDALTNELEACRYSRDMSLNELSYANDEYQDAIRAFEEAKTLMTDKLERLKAISERVKTTSSDYSTLVKKKAKVTDEYLDLRLKVDNNELQKNIAEIDKDEKQTKKLEKKSKKDVQPILKKIQKMPYDVVLLIRDYLPYDVRVSLIDDKFNAVMAKCKGANTPQMFVAFLNYAATCPEFLRLLGRKEARHQIPSITPRGYHWRHFTYCLSRKTNKPMTQLVKNKINWISKLAKAGNPEFAYKMMKTVVVFGDIERHRLVQDISSKRYLTLEDLPAKYR